MNDKDTSSYPNLCNAAKAVFRGRFIAVNAYINKAERSQINNLPLLLRHWKKSTLNLKCRRKAIIKIRMENNETENRKMIEKVNEAGLVHVYSCIIHNSEKVEIVPISIK